MSDQHQEIEKSVENQEPVLLARPLDERRAIMVVESGSDTRNANWTLTGAAVGLALGGPLGAAVGGWAASAASKKLDSGIVKIHADRVARESFPAGHPVVGVRYLVHPIDQRRYLPAADYATAIFDEKRRELTTLLLSLGARRVRVRSRRRQERSFSVGIGANAPSKVGTVKVGTADKQGNIDEFVTSDDILNVPTHEPRIPEGLLWYPHEPAWRDLSRDRLEHGVQVLNCQVIKRSLSELAADLKVGVELLGGEVNAAKADGFEELLEFHADFRKVHPAQWIALGVAAALAVATLIAWLLLPQS